MPEPTVNDQSSSSEPGFFGKLPVYGDFIHKRLPRDFITPWDDWLQVGLAAAKERLPGTWLDYYLSCPAWTFVLGAGICGEQPCTGVTIPSVDRVGRYFNFTLAAMLPMNTAPAAFLLSNREWLDRLASLAVDILVDEYDQDQIDGLIAELGNPDTSSTASPKVDGDEHSLRLTFRTSDPTVNQVRALLHQLLNERFAGTYGLWLQGGSSQVPPRVLAGAQMPSTTMFLDMMISEDAGDPEPASDDLVSRFLSS